MSHYKPYPAYKDSGVEWLGKVPEHWIIGPYKALIQIENGSDYKEVEADEGFPVIGSGGAFAYASQKMYEGESVLLGRKGTIDKPLYVNGPFWTVDTMYWSIIKNGACGRFAYYIATTIPFDLYSTNTALPSMTKSVLGAHQIAFPDISEQKVIAAHLDCETARIDALISKKTRFIELLREKRQALITHAVTKGLDHSVKMKDSGVEWLGEVPEHWSVKPIKFLKSSGPNSFVDGPFGSNLKSEHFIQYGDVYVIESNFATQGKLSPDDLKTISYEHFKSISRSEVRAGDIVIAKIGAQFGKCSILPVLDKLAVISGNSLKLTLNEEICSQVWGYWQFVNLKNIGAIDDLAKGGAQPALSLGDLNSMKILVPPKEEQENILLNLSQRLVRYDSIVAATERSIELLKERRTSLITALVTGQINILAFVNDCV